MKLTPLPFAGALLLALCGCQTKHYLYYWGNYESVAYLSYVKPAQATLQIQLEKLEEDVNKTAAGKGHAHPGLHAQLGYVYYQLGRTDDAVREFQAEKTLFPESAVFMDRLMGKVKIAPST